MSSCSAPIVSPVDRPAESGGAWRLIRALERAASAAALALLSPLLISTALVIITLSRRAPLVAHLRVGQFGAPFWTLKFRTMWPAKSSAGLRIWPVEYVVDESFAVRKSSDDPRVTSRLARFFRRYSIDELPQLVNVLRGEMALVGPRPLIERELKVYYGADSAELLQVKPGITGLWQVMGRSRLTYHQRRRLDLFLVRSRSLGLYLKILWRTLPVVLRGKDGW